MTEIVLSPIDVGAGLVVEAARATEAAGFEAIWTTTTSPGSPSAVAPSSTHGQSWPPLPPTPPGWLSARSS